MTEQGTIEQIRAEVGDILKPIDNCDGTQTFEVMDNCRLRVHYGDGATHVISRGWYWDSCIWAVISRAAQPTATPDLTAITTPFGLLDEATKEALRAHGGPYEIFAYRGWNSLLFASFDDHMTYRVKPEPKRETVTVERSIDDLGCISMASGYTPIRVNFDRVDGKIDLSTYKVEPR